jgi:glycosyltransferase involved in cell wall biosynthesis
MRSVISITAVIPCYNSSDTIEQCIRSVFSQTEAIDELIVVDDGSTDHSTALIDKIFENKPEGVKTKLFRQNNRGPAAARNSGIRMAGSSHIAFIDADDAWYPDKILHEKRLLEAFDYDLIASVYDSAPPHYSGLVTFKRQLLKNYFLTPCVVAKKEALLAVGGFDEGMRHAEDYFLWLKLCYRYKAYLLDHKGGYSVAGKRIFGDSGLSSNLQAMHQGVLNCYRALHKMGMISKVEFLSLYGMEKIKFARRIWISKG